MNQNPTMEKASDNISKILNPKETNNEKSARISKEISRFIGDLQ